MMHRFSLFIFLFGGVCSQNYDVDEILNSSYDVEILSDYAGIDDTIGLNYISSVNKSAYHELILNKLPKRSDSTYEFIRNAKGQLFACKLPDVQKSSPEPKSSDLSYNPKYLAEVIAKDFKKNPCVEYNAGWWSYRFCHERMITQFHDDSNEEGKIRNILGTFSGHYEMADFTESTEESLLYIDEEYDRGTTCDLPSYQEPRRVIVRYECGLSYASPAVIQNVEEISSCVYRLTVQVHSLCDLPVFRPVPAKKPTKIICKPLLSDEQIESFLEKQMRSNIIKMQCSRARKSLRSVRASTRRRLRTLRRLQLMKNRISSEERLRVLEDNYNKLSELYVANIYCEANGKYPTTSILNELKIVADYLDEADANEDRNEDTAASFLKNLNKIASTTKDPYSPELREPGYKMEDSRNLWYYFHDKHWNKNDFPLSTEFVDVSNEYFTQMKSIEVDFYSTVVQRKLLYGNPYRIDQNGLITVEKADRWWSVDDQLIIDDVELYDHKDMFLFPENNVERRVVIETLMFHYLNHNMQLLRRGLQFSNMDERVNFVAQWLSPVYSYIVIHGSSIEHTYLHEHVNANFNRDIYAAGSISGDVIERITLATLFIERSIENKRELVFPTDGIKEFETSPLLEAVNRFYGETVGPRSNAVEERVHKHYSNIMLKSIAKKANQLFRQAWYTQRKAMLFNKKMKNEFVLVSAMTDVTIVGDSPEDTIESLLSSREGKSITGAEVRIEVVGAEDVDTDLVNALIEQKITTLKQIQKTKDDEEAYSTVLDF